MAGLNAQLVILVALVFGLIVWLMRRLAVPPLAISAAVLALVLVSYPRLTLRPELFGYIGFTLGVSAAVTVLALIFLRLREGPERVRVPGFPVVPIVFVVATLWAAGFMVVREPTQAVLGLATALVGVPVYYWLRRRDPSSRPGPAASA